MNNRGVFAGGCPACRNSTAVPYRTVGKMGLLRCGTCELVFRNPVPTPRELEGIYEKGYYDSWGGEAAEALVSRQKRTYFLQHIQHIKRLMGKGTLLDVGCAKGNFLELARSEGYSVYGLEISEYAADAAAGTVGKERIEVGTIEGSSHPPGMFDVITMFDFIEHVHDLDATLAAVSELIKSDGLLYIVTPSTSSMSFKFMGSQWWHYKEEHLYYFNRKSLAALLERFGFQVLDSAACKKTLSVEYMLNQLDAYPVFLLSGIAKYLGALIPLSFRKHFITLPSGEFRLMARKA